MAQLGKLTVITAFDAADTAYPILGILCDPRVPGYAVPPDLEPHPDTQAWPNHVFHSSVPAQNDGRVQWLYSIFPGPFSTVTRQDYDGETLTTKTRRNIAANIITQETLTDGVWTQNYQQQQNDNLIAIETQEYRTVPGNYVPFTRYDLQLGPINGTRRLVANSGLVTTLTAIYKRTYEAHENSKAVCWELIETNSDGTGSAGNPAYPIRVTDFFDNDRGAVHKVSQVVTDITTAGSLVVTGTAPTAVATLTRYEPLNQFLRDKIVETFTINGPLLRSGEKYDTELGLVTATKQLVYATTTPAQSEDANGRTRYEASSYGNPVLWEIKESWVTANFPTLDDDFYDKELGAVARDTVLTTDTSTAGSETSSTRVTYEPRNDFLRKRITDTWITANFPTFKENFYDEARGAVGRTTILSTDTTTAGSLSVAGGTTVTEISYQPRNAFLRKLITETWTVPAPLRTSDDYDLQRGAVQTTLQIIEGTSVDGTLSASGGVVTETSYRALNAVLIERKIQTFAYPGPELVAEPEIDRDGAVFTVKRQLNLATAITEGEDNGGGTLLTIITSEPYSGQATGPLRWKVTKTRALPGTAWTRADVDGETGTPVSITMQIIATPSFPLTQATGSEITYQPISSVHGFKITTSLVSYASVSMVDYPTGKMTAPALITSATFDSIASRDGTPNISILWTKRAAKTREVKMTRTKSYGSQSAMQAARNALTLENPGTIDLIRDPFFFPAIREMNVLTDAVSLGPYTTGTENPKWPYATETVSWTATTPSATDYPGRSVVLSAEVEYWKYNLWRLTKIEATTF